MIQFVNAKINLGLSVVDRRADGYHLLETCFMPVGLYNGSPDNPEPFCDILELSDGHAAPLSASDTVHDGDGIRFIFSGRHIDCAPEKNLVVRAASAFAAEYRRRQGRAISDDLGFLTLSMVKMIPDGAGLGGGSADATFTLRLLNERSGGLLTADELEALAVGLGADCPVFVRNRPVFAEGIGEVFSEVDSPGLTQLLEEHYWLALVKPDLHISTREAFAGLHPRRPVVSLRDAVRRPIEEWRGCVRNDFEESLFPLYPELPRLKESLYASGALYASMTGSGAALYGIFAEREAARAALSAAAPPYSALIRL